MNSDVVWKLVIIGMFGLTIFTSWYGNHLALKALDRIEAIQKKASTT